MGLGGGRSSPLLAPFLRLERELAVQRARTGDPLAQLIASDIERQLGRGGRPAETDELADDAGGDSAVEAMLKRMRQRGVEGGN